MTGKQLLIWGASGHAAVVAEIAELVGFDIAAFVDDRPSSSASAFLGLPVLRSRDEVLELRRRNVDWIVIGIGSCEARLTLGRWAAGQGFASPALIHPRATVSARATVGPGSVVAAAAVINPGSIVGSHAIINTAATVDHDCRIHDGVHLSPGVRLGGSVTVHEGAWIGIGASVIDKISVGQGCIVGAGAVVVRDIPAGVVAFGVPARVARTIQ